MFNLTTRNKQEVMDKIFHSHGQYKIINVKFTNTDYPVFNVFSLMKTRGEDEYHRFNFEFSRKTLELTDYGRVWSGTLNDAYYDGFIDNYTYNDLKKRFKHG